VIAAGFAQIGPFLIVAQFRRAQIHALAVDPARAVIDGPGIADADLATAMRRGARLDERTPGSGLGLSITAALAASYDGELQLEGNTSAGGLRASLSLPGGRAE
jgi:signal transduction histidine kinase